MTINVPEVSIDLDLGTVDVTIDRVSVEVTQDMPAVTIGVPGPVGLTGLVKVAHGSDPDVPRPPAPLVYWVGSVAPVNADPDDLLLLRD